LVYKKNPQKILAIGTYIFTIKKNQDTCSINSRYCFINSRHCFINSRYCFINSKQFHQ